MQREHFKTDWHRYNLKRKVAELPPVTSEEFEKRIVQQRNADSMLQEDQSLYCKACKKVFKSQSSHDNHLNSKKHQENLKNFQKIIENVNEEVSVKATKFQKPTEEEAVGGVADDGMEIEEIDSDEWDDDTENPIANNDCIFCDHHSKNLVNNVKHMSLKHSFFIPDAEFCVDVEGLLSYLAEKVCRDFICIWCNEKGKTFYSLDAVRKHMSEKGHCKILYEGASLAEFVEFYDYSTSYPDHNEEMDVDVEIEGPQVLDGDEYQLVLPSGAVLGHRSLLRYYKQKINPNRVVVKKSTEKLHKVLAQYRAIGWTSTEQESAARNARDIHAMKRQQAKLIQKVAVKANKLQKHFRQQVNF
jgi:pre-60S factor REI1